MPISSSFPPIPPNVAPPTTSDPYVHDGAGGMAARSNARRSEASFGNVLPNRATRSRFGGRCGVRPAPRRRRRGGTRVVLLRAVDDLLDRTGFDDLAFEQDDDPVGEVADDRQVVGDEQHGDAVTVVDVEEEIEDLGLDRDVERGDGLVAHE